MSDSVQPHGQEPTRLLCPWDSPGKDTVVGCHALLWGIFPMQGSNLHLFTTALAGRFFTTSVTRGSLACVGLVAHSCPSLGDPMDYSPAGSTGILQARILEWVAMPSSRECSRPRDRTQASHTAGGFSTSWAIRDSLSIPKKIFPPVQKEEMKSPVILKCSPWGSHADNLSLYSQSEHFYFYLFYILCFY